MGKTHKNTTGIKNYLKKLCEDDNLWKEVINDYLMHGLAVIDIKDEEGDN